MDFFIENMAGTRKFEKRVPDEFMESGFVSRHENWNIPEMYRPPTPGMQRDGVR